MPYTLTQLDSQYKAACEKITDCKEYTLQNLRSSITLNVEDFFAGLNQANLREYEAEFVVMDEVIQQCRLAIKHEKSRRSFEEKIEDQTFQHHKKTMQQLAFKTRKRMQRLNKATPNTSASRQHSVEDGNELY